MLSHVWRRGPLRAAVVAGVTASTATALAVVGPSAADQHPDPGRDGRGATARNVIFLHGDGMGPSAPRADAPGHQGAGRRARDGSAPLRRRRRIPTPPTRRRPSPTRPPARPRTRAACAPTTARSASTCDGRPVPTLLERARAAGKATGLVTTAQVTDATPAAFGAHVPDRAQQSEIARQYLDSSKPDVILGGGEDRWLPPGEPGAYPDNPAKDPTEQSSSDRGNLIERAQQLGYEYVSDRAGLRQQPRRASCSGCSPTRRCSSSAPRARGTSTSRSSRWTR